MRSSIHAEGGPQPFPPAAYTTPRWPSLFWPPLEDRYVLYHLGDMWRFTLIWTFVMYACFHWAAIGIALIVQIGKKKTNWKYLWTVPIIYSAIAALEALVAGSVTGAMFVVSPASHVSSSWPATDSNPVKTGSVPFTGQLDGT